MYSLYRIILDPCREEIRLRTCFFNIVTLHTARQASTATVTVKGVRAKQMRGACQVLLLIHNKITPPHRPAPASLRDDAGSVLLPSALCGGAWCWNVASPCQCMRLCEDIFDAAQRHAPQAKGQATPATYYYY